MSKITFHDLDEFKLPDDPRKTLQPGEGKIYLKSYDSTESLYVGKDEDGTTFCALFKDEEQIKPPPLRKPEREFGLWNLVVWAFYLFLASSLALIIVPEPLYSAISDYLGAVIAFSLVFCALVFLFSYVVVSLDRS